MNREQMIEKAAYALGCYDGCGSDGEYCQHNADAESVIDAILPQVRVQIVARFTVEGEPVSKARARFTGYKSKSRAYTPEKTKAAEDRMAWQFKLAAPTHKPDNQYTYGIMAVFFHGTRQRRDVDNMLKLICDALNGVAWADDVQVEEVSARRGYDSAHPRTEVLIYRVGRVEVGSTLTCADCGGPKSKPSYVRCAACAVMARRKP